MRFDALLLAAALAVAAPDGRADEAAAPPVAKADHVDMVVSGKPLAGWPIDMARAEGAILLADDGTWVTIAKAAAAKIVATSARPVTEIPGDALVEGMARAEETVRDRCQELLEMRGAEAEPFLKLALTATSVEPRRRALAILTRTPIARLAPAVRARVSDQDERVRAAALEAYAKLKQGDAFRLCVETLQGDFSLLVQHAAAQQIGRLGDLHGVDALLDHLSVCDNRDVRIVIFAALHNLSGKGFGRDETAWRAWWTNHRDELLPDEDH